MEVEVFADVWCPFAHVGLRRFVTEREARGGGPLLRVRAWPLELIDGAPLDPASVAHEIDQIRASAAPELFAGFDAERFPSTTLPALELTAAAYRQSPDLGEAVALELRDRLFERGEDVGDPAVLAAVADRHGLDAAVDDHGVAARADWKEGTRRGVTGSPHFFTPDGDFFCPSLDVRTVDGVLRVSDDPEGFAAFVASSFPKT